MNQSTQEAKEARAVIVGDRLDDVAKILTGALVAVAGLLAALGLTSERVFIALNNSPKPLMAAAGLAILAIMCSILSLFCRSTPGGTKLQTFVLALGVILYIGALTVSVAGAADQASGNGRPTVTGVKIEGERPKLTLSFKVRADGVRRDHHVSVFIRPLILKENGEFEPTIAADVYAASLRPDDEGVVEQTINMPLVPAKATYLNISVSNSGDKGAGRCDTESTKAPACVKLQLP